MASIKKRNDKYAVVYYYVDDNGRKKQKWETCNTRKEALKRKAEVENQIMDRTFIPPNDQTLATFLYDFVSLYGEKRWGVSSYDSNVGLIENYIIPAIGDTQVQDVTPKFVDQFYQRLQKTKPVVKNKRKAKSAFLTAATIEKIHKLLSCAFKQAVRWEMIPRNLFEFALVPKVKYNPRDIWTADMIRTALDACRDSKLYIAMNLSFACSLRIGEALGLTWDNVYVSDENIIKDDAYIYVNKELSRASLRLKR